MPGTVSEPPTVPLSFSNNFWGKDDAGVSPLLERMHNAKVTGDELKAFYTTRAAIEEEYARKLLNLARKPLGSSEAGTLRMSLDVVRGEIESIGKSHQNIAGQMKSELEEPLSAFAAGLKERRKIVHTGIEKLLKVKTQQTTTVNKAREKYEQDCLKIKGYLAQGHMVMGQEERKNKAKLEKTQIQLSATSNEYETAIKILEETTGRWNRDWKAACDKFQDLEEERIDFMKSSLWSFANIASSVCVSDDASCEKIRLSLEECDVEKDISTFIRESGTGQEIPDPPKYINFCRGDVDTASEADDDSNYSVAQFQRTINPAFRSSSPQPSALDSHNDTHMDPMTALNNGPSQVAAHAELARVPLQNPLRTSGGRPSSRGPPPIHQNTLGMSGGRPPSSGPPPVQQAQFADVPQVPHNQYPMDGMTQFCRLGPPSERSSAASPVRPSSRGSQSDYSNPTSFSSFEPSSGAQSPTKPFNGSAVSSVHEDNVPKKKSGFFQSHSPFRRKSKHERENVMPATEQPTPTSRNTWGASSARGGSSENISPTRRGYGHASGALMGSTQDRWQPSPSPEPVDPRANFQLNIGNNVFDVASPDAPRNQFAKPQNDDLDPIAQALEELKGVTKNASMRVSADRYHGLATPVPPSCSGGANTPVGGIPAPFAERHRMLGTPPPSYEQPISRLDPPKPAFTARQMQERTRGYQEQKRDMFGSSPASNPPPLSIRPGNTYDSRNAPSRPASRAGTQPPDSVRVPSPQPMRAVSPRPGLYGDPGNQRGYTQQGQQHSPYRATSPNPYASSSVPAQNQTGAMGQRSRAHSTSPIKPRTDGYGVGPASGYGNIRPAGHVPRAVSPQPAYGGGTPGRAGAAGPQAQQISRAVSPALPPLQQSRYGTGMAGSRPGSSNGMAMQLSHGHPPQQQSMAGGRSAMGYGSPAGSGGAGGAGVGTGAGAGVGEVGARARGKSVADGRQYNKDRRVILHYARALYLYTAAIPEELSFAKGDVLAVLRLQDDGWWEAEVVGRKGGRPGLVPSNYLAPC